ncbi:hypothetical protein [Aporhodopirellula aestuarii]|uniref:Uncharacterized protein n=1 Tax=Aporhodopirellula aestuarii TaxID=2950107 RepID=A0ABT0U7S1_9BACT|nr:hypothetical protein [Aporhodopirellula aestuarii]MCM2372974.1 hypothetical protein [Aporhodopirellula aestuarii]
MCRQSSRSFVAICFAALLLSGCVQKVYEIHLQPDGASITRTLTVWTETTGSDDTKISPLPQAELDRVREFYDPKNDVIEGDRHVFVGQFGENMPGDVGGAGRYVFFDSSLGSTSFYSERFRGDDDLLASIDARHQAVDNIITLLLHWSRSEFSQPEVRERVESFVDQDLRRDLKNFSTYCWTHAMLSDLDEQKVLERFSARMMQYLVERDYISWQDVPKVLRAFQSEDPQRLAELLHETVVRKLGLPERESVAILADPERLATSLRESIRETEIFRSEFTRHQQEHASSVDDGEEPEPFDPLGLLTSYALQATLPKSDSGRTTVRVKIDCGVEPYATNGDWDDDQQAVTWSDSIDDVNIPAMVFAGWSNPDEEMQQAVFGKVVLSGEELAQYVFWFQGLDTDERTQWDAFLGGLDPGDNLLGQIEAFEFTDDENLAETPRELLLEALKEAESP